MERRMIWRKIGHTIMRCPPLLLEKATPNDK
jgi:hypothetical protein